MDRNTVDGCVASQAPDAARTVPVVPHGRGTGSSMAHRFAREVRSVVDDGWGGADKGGMPGDSDGDSTPAPATQVIIETARSALCANDSPDISFDQSVNPYRGCEHVM